MCQKKKHDRKIITMIKNYYLIENCKKKIDERD